MVKESLNTSIPISKSNTLRNVSLQTFDLPILIEKMKHELSWVKGELNAMILMKNQDKQIVLTALHEETEIISFQSNDSVTVQIIEGRLKFHTKKESVLLHEGELLTLYDKIKYSLITKEETVFLLTIANDKLKAIVT